MKHTRPRVVVVATLAMATACVDASDDGLDDGSAPIDGECEDLGAPADPWADCVVEFAPADDVSFGHDALPAIVLGAPEGGGEGMGGTHVASLGCGGSITLGFLPPWPTDGPGPDLVVFENAFVAGAITFIEPAAVLVSDDGVEWQTFGCAPTGGTEAPEGCAGLEPVLAPDLGATVDPAAAGGDAFDLADVGLAEARFVRLIDRTAEHYGSQTWCLGAAGGFDLDAVARVEAAP